MEPLPRTAALLFDRGQNEEAAPITLCVNEFTSIPKFELPPIPSSLAVME